MVVTGTQSDALHFCAYLIFSIMKCKKKKQTPKSEFAYLLFNVLSGEASFLV